jgi:hypothetical protein
MLITRKQNETMAAKKRYVKGLDQLAFAETQVSRTIYSEQRNDVLFRLVKCV